MGTRFFQRGKEAGTRSWPLASIYCRSWELVELHFYSPYMPSCRGEEELYFYEYLDDWLTVLHRGITLVDLQLDAQNSYLFTNNTFIKILYMFRTLPCSSSGGLRRNCIYMQPLVSSLSAGDCRVHRIRKVFLNRCTGQSPAESDNTRGCTYTITT